MRFLGQTAIVTGASRGIGIAVAGSLVSQGARVVITGRDNAALGVATELLGGAGRLSAS
jgi:NAD(P)-dependent dehydrogenase (short-subunit alcohol dehydrogenase family)